MKKEELKFAVVSEENGKLKKFTKFPVVVIYTHFDNKVNIYPENEEIIE